MIKLHPPRRCDGGARALPGTGPESSGRPSRCPGCRASGGAARGTAGSPGRGHAVHRSRARAAATIRFRTPIPATEGVIKVNFVEFATVPDARHRARRASTCCSTNRARAACSSTRCTGMLYAVSYDGKTRDAVSRSQRSEVGRTRSSPAAPNGASRASRSTRNSRSAARRASASSTPTSTPRT